MTHHQAPTASSPSHQKPPQRTAEVRGARAVRRGGEISVPIWGRGGAVLG